MGHSFLSGGIRAITDLTQGRDRSAVPTILCGLLVGAGAVLLSDFVDATAQRFCLEAAGSAGAV